MSKSNKREMHPRNIFRTPPDYTALAIKNADFRKVCTLELSGKVSIDYKQANTLPALTKVLLSEYFQLNVDFAPTSLVPTLPLRLNYILWLEDLLGTKSSAQVRGIDIGCGSSCIYSLLAAKKNGWHMSALESNAVNIEYAEANIARNQLDLLITLFKQTNENVILANFIATLPSESTFDFCLCNPPFFDSSNSNPFHSMTRNSSTRAPPHNCHTGRDDELACQGGEVHFVQRIIEESLVLRQRIRIYTSMLGRKRSLIPILKALQSHDIMNFTTSEFCQGNTTRWGVAWSFHPVEVSGVGDSNCLAMTPSTA